MNRYLTIGAFAKLRGVNINSLLYYERLGILCPSYIDPDTKYRYYAPEQLFTLDLILLCINLDIPLKNLKQYQKENNYWQSKMLEDGKRIAEEKIHQMQIDLNKIEYTLQCQEDQKEYWDCEGIYQRKIPERFFIAEEYFGDLSTISQFGHISTALFAYAKEHDFSVVPPTGFMFVFQPDAVRQYLYYEILPPTVNDSKIIRIPAETYSCKQVQFDPDLDYLQFSFLKEHFQTTEHRIVIVSNSPRDQVPINTRYNEIQVLDGYSLL